MSITSSNIPKSYEPEDSTLPNHADESSVCSTPLPPLMKLDGVEPVSGTKTIKLVLMSKSTFKAETLKGLGEYSFGGACEKSATIHLTYAEYFIKVVYTTSPWKMT
nr:hypothetical protein [Tanacetum cinerariifolium]